MVSSQLDGGKLVYCVYEVRLTQGLETFHIFLTFERPNDIFENKVGNKVNRGKEALFLAYED